jgi:hypothetical protein
LQPLPVKQKTKDGHTVGETARHHNALRHTRETDTMRMKYSSAASWPVNDAAWYVRDSIITSDQEPISSSMKQELLDFMTVSKFGD